MIERYLCLIDKMFKSQTEICVGSILRCGFDRHTNSHLRMQITRFA